MECFAFARLSTHTHTRTRREGIEEVAKYGTWGPQVGPMQYNPYYSDEALPGYPAAFVVSAVEQFYKSGNVQMVDWLTSPKREWISMGDSPRMPADVKRKSSFMSGKKVLAKNDTMFEDAMDKSGPKKQSRRMFLSELCAFHLDIILC